jgi:hypothetical protein
VVLTTSGWLTGRGRRSSRRVLDPELLDPVDEGSADAWSEPPRRRSKGAAAATEDRFMDVVVLLSVLMFLLLAAGVGLLVLRSTLLPALTG